jgi:hypothetical protein
MVGSQGRDDADLDVRPFERVSHVGLLGTSEGSSQEPMCAGCGLSCPRDFSTGEI